MEIDNAIPNSYNPPILILIYKTEMGSIRLVPNEICISFNIYLTNSLHGYGRDGCWEVVNEWQFESPRTC